MTSFVIIHPSSIVQYGLAEILKNNFKCNVRTFVSIDNLPGAVDLSFADSYLFIQEKLKRNKQFELIIAEASFIKIIGISDEEESADEDINSVSIFASNEEVYNTVKKELNLREEPNIEQEGLSSREIEVLKLVALGHSNKEIADILFISIHTVMSHRKNITEKLGIKSISGLTVYAIINNHINTSGMDVSDLI